MLTYDELISDETATEIADRIRAYLLAGGLPTGSWAPSPIGMENLRVEAVAAAVQALMAKRIGGIARGRLLTTATDTPLVDGGDGPWLSYVGQEVFRLTRRAASKTIKYVALYSLAADAQPVFDFEPGDLVVASPSTGNRYISLDGGHFDGTRITPPGTFAGNALVLRFEAEEAGLSYADPAGTITQMVTAKAGVLCTNLRPTMFEPALMLGSSGGMGAAFFTYDSATGTYPAPAYDAVIARIDSSGDVGTATWSYRTPGGVWVPAGPVVHTTDVPTGTTISWTDGTASPSFVKGDLFVFLVASDVAQQGADLETEADFAQACRYRHVQISDVPMPGAMALMARAASPEVTRVTVDGDADVPGLAVLTMSSAVGPASPAALQAVQAFVGSRLYGFRGVGAGAVSNAPEERALAVSAQAFSVTPGGTVFCPRALVAAAKVAANRAWLAYLATVPIGASAAAVVKLAVLEQVIADAGADDVDGATLNGASANLLVPANQVVSAAAGTSIGETMTWVPT